MNLAEMSGLDLMRVGVSLPGNMGDQGIASVIPMKIIEADEGRVVFLATADARHTNRLDPYTEDLRQPSWIRQRAARPHAAACGRGFRDGRSQRQDDPAGSLRAADAGGGRGHRPDAVACHLGGDADGYGRQDLRPCVGHVPDRHPVVSRDGPAKPVRRSSAARDAEGGAVSGSGVCDDVVAVDPVLAHKANGGGDTAGEHMGP